MELCSIRFTRVNSTCAVLGWPPFPRFMGIHWEDPPWHQPLAATRKHYSYPDTAMHAIETMPSPTKVEQQAPSQGIGRGGREGEVDPAPPMPWWASASWSNWTGWRGFEDSGVVQGGVQEGEEVAGEYIAGKGLQPGLQWLMPRDRPHADKWRRKIDVVTPFPGVFWRPCQAPLCSGSLCSSH